MVTIPLCLSVHAVAVSVGRQSTQQQRTLAAAAAQGRNTYGTVLNREQLVNMVEKKPFQRLPASVKPKHYVLTLSPDLKALTFNGEVSIHIEVCMVGLLRFWGGFLCGVCRFSSFSCGIFRQMDHKICFSVILRVTKFVCVMVYCSNIFLYHSLNSKQSFFV